MKLVEIRCPNCGGDIKVNPEKEKLICGYCHTEFLVDDEVKKVETHHTYTDEAEIKRAEVEKEIELKKLEIEEEKVKAKRKFKIIIFATIVVLIIIGIPILVNLNKSGFRSIY